MLSTRRLFTLCAFMSAFLLFLVQPMVAKLILPELGGSPSVWITVMLFFQLLLLGGYAYVHFTTQKLSLNMQRLVHVALAAGALYFLPLALNTDIPVDRNEMPVSWLLVSLAYTIGVPFFVLSASAPLLQRRFGTSNDPDAANPYFLYSAGNAGSLIALLSYPFLIEPLVTLGQQRLSWSILYMVFFALLILADWRTRNLANSAIAITANNLKSDIPFKRKILWVFLGFIPSSLMLALTSYITTDIAAMPLLWIIPLALYLLSFILVFAKKMPTYEPCKKHIALILTLLTILLMLTTRPGIETIAAHILLFFMICIFCHGKLAESKPDIHGLTGYYLCMSLGGALGGIFNAIIAPALFTFAIEYQLTIILAGIAFAITGDPGSKLNISDFIISAGLAVVIWLSSTLTFPDAVKLLMVGIKLIAIIMMFRFGYNRPQRFALTLALILSITILVPASNAGTILHRERNFFGVSKVSENKELGYHAYLHGTTLHGMQSTRPGEQMDVVSYYYIIPQELLPALPEETREKPIAVVGIGAGTLACAALPHQQMDMYDIDPAVIHIATNPHYFTYLRDCPGKRKIILGDARLTLKEAPAQRYGVMLMDAYSSDALPIHLLTREALAIYRKALAPHGVIAFHISNQHMDLAPVIATLAEDARMQAYYRKNIVSPAQHRLYASNMWMVLAESKEDLGTLDTSKEKWRLIKPERKILWTDDFSNILSVLKK